MLIEDKPTYFKITCPFCTASTSSSNDDFGRSVVKEYTGQHLARHHRAEMRAVAQQRLKRGEAIRGVLLHG